MGLAVLYGPGFIRWAELKAQQAELRTEVARLKAENSRLHAEARRLREDPSYAEAIARRELGFVRQGETMIKWGKAEDEN